MNGVMLEFYRRKFGGEYVCFKNYPLFFFVFFSSELKIKTLVLKHEKCCISGYTKG